MDDIRWIVKPNWQRKGYRLPTEAEWEYAARGGNRSKGFAYSGSNDIDSVAWYGVNSRNQTHSVKRLKANELGLYDMSGNVYEWCYDWTTWYDDYDPLQTDNPRGRTKGDYRVLRGGSWYDFPSHVRTAHRRGSVPLRSDDPVGVRMVRGDD